MLDLRIAHERLNDSGVVLTLVLMDAYITLDVDRSLDESASDKIRNHTDYNNIPPMVISFMSVIPSTSGRIHSEFVRLLFLQAHRETDRFFFIFRSSACVFQQWTFPLPSRGVLLSAEIKDCQYSS